MNGKFLLISRYFPPAEKAGGPIRTLDALLKTSTRSGDVRVITTAHDLDGSLIQGVPLDEWTTRDSAQVNYSSTTRRYFLELLKTLRTCPRVVYLNSYFSPWHSLLPTLLHKLGAWPNSTLVIAPRGELGSGALALKSTKKSLVIRLSQAIKLHGNVTWHATSRGEAESIRHLYPGAHLILKPNPSNLPSVERSLRANHPRVSITYIGRISPIKGLHILIEALSHITDKQIHLDVLGGSRPDEEVYHRSCASASDSLPTNITVSFHGHATRSQILATLDRSDLMALPTGGENFGHAILEALSRGCPVMLPDNTPWSEEAKLTHTLVPNLTPSAWTVAISEFSARTRHQLARDSEIAMSSYIAWRSTQTEETIVDTLMPTFQHLKVAIVTQGYSTSGGLQAVSRWLRSGLESSGIKTTVFDLANSSQDPSSRRILAPSSWTHRPQLTPDTREDHVFNVGTDLAELEPFRYAPRRNLTRHLQEHDIVQVVAGGPSLALAASKSGRPVVLQMATFVQWERESILREQAGSRRAWTTLATRLITRLEPLALRGADAVMVENQEAMRRVAALAPGQDVRLAPPGVDNTAYHPSSAPWNRLAPIVTVGRLNEPRKSYSRMLAAYGDLVSEMPNCPPLHIIGRGDASSLRREINEHGLSHHVKVFANEPIEDLQEQLRNSSVFWQTSYEEGLGISVLEAMASGLPVVASRTAGSNTTVEHGKTGFLTPQDNDALRKAFVGYTIAILSGEGEQMSLAARARTEETFDSEKTLMKFIQTYRQQLAAHSPTDAE